MNSVKSAFVQIHRSVDSFNNDLALCCVLKDKPMEARDATGNFVAYLYPRKPVYATEVSGRFDVGGLQSYITCNEHFMKLHS